MKKRIFIATAVLFSSQLYAQQDSTKTLNKIVLTATKSSIKQSQTGKVVTIIDQSVLEKSKGKDLAQLLTEQANIIVNGATSNPGKDKPLYIRGAKNDNTVILIDGIPMADPSGVTGAFDPRLIPMENIERIEIVKGAQSALYGSNAVAGVINIITKKGAGKEAVGYGTISAGSYKSFNANIGVRGTIEKSSYDVGYIHRQTDGISEAKDIAGNQNFDNDGFVSNGAYLNFDAAITDKFHFKPFFRYQYFTGGYDADAFTDGADQYTSSVLSTGTIFKYDDKKLSLTAQYAHDETSRLYDGVYGKTPYEGRSNTAETYATYRINDMFQVLAGLDFRAQQSLDDNATPKRPKINIFSPYTSVLYKNANGINVELGGRYNKHSKFGDNFNYSINPSYLIKNKVKVFANIASAFRAPSLGELYGQYGSNPDLKPETSKTFEGGAQAFFNKGDIRAVYFNREIKNIISSGPAFSLWNYDRQNDHGFEVESNIAVNKDIKVTFFYSFVDGEITKKKGSKDTTYYNLLKLPKHSFGVTVGYQVTPQLFVSTNGYSYGKRNDLFFNPNPPYDNYAVELRSYFMWNAYAQYSILSNRIKVFVDVKNILDKDYYEVYGYGVQGFNTTAGLSFKL
ncbi:TonB-dependent receptor plug domain-containing protein [Ferruginibacter sp. SUN002]|uniref:TonB-dependent receptor plug domain-containing protein n=1 Tax=Ferruginibacter sp. SUN002 TaxID=2937789 RepID=UPI003D363B5C